MTAADWAAAAGWTAFVACSVLLLVVGCRLRELEDRLHNARAVDHSTCRETEDGLRDQVHASEEVANHWYRKAEVRYRDPGFLDPRPSLNWTDKAGRPLGYNEPSAFGPVEAARRGMTLGEHTADALGRVEGRVIPMQRRGQS